MRDSNLKATAYFEVVARLGTVTKAADELGVSPSAISQQIRLLEQQFGVKLFRREKRRLVLTLDGDRLFQTTTQAFRAIRNARNAISRQRDTRNLTVRVSPSFGVRWLGPRIWEFAAAHKGLVACRRRIDGIGREDRTDLRSAAHAETVTATRASGQENCPSSDNLGRLSVFQTGGSGSPLIDVKRFQFRGASAGW